jgi:hypothetical protein
MEIKQIKNLIKHEKVKQISENIFEVEEHSVIIKGSSLLCNCEAEVFNSMCYHRWAVVVYLANKDFLKRIDKLIQEYEGYKDNNLKPNVDCFLNDLNSIKEKW